MTTRSVRPSDADRIPFDTRRFGAAAVVLVAATAVGAISAVVGPAPIGGALAISVALAIGVANWRLSLLLLCVYLPISGIPVLLGVPSPSLALLLKDGLWVIPAYVGFAGWMIGGALSRVIAAPLVRPAFALALVVLAQLANPGLQNIAVGLIGVKLWLLYVPLLWLAYFYARDLAGLRRPLVAFAVVGSAALTVGLVQAALIYGGYAQLVYAVYGPAAADVTQQYAQANFEGGGFLRRVPGTFTFGAQYFGFAVTMVAATYALLRSAEQSRRLVWGAAFVLAVIAALLSGSKGAALAVPALVLLMLVCEGASRRVWAGAGIALFTSLALMFAVLGAQPLSVIAQAWDLMVGYAGDTIASLGRVADATLLGRGPGMDSTASRYAFLNPNDFQIGLAGTWLEDWFSKTLVEIGIVGLVVAVALVALLVVEAIQSRLRAPRAARGFAGAILGYLLWQVGYLIKGSLVDLDPVNVTFWLFAGLLLAAGRLDATDGSPAVDGRRG